MMVNKNTVILALLGFLLSIQVFGQIPTPGSSKHKKILLLGGVAHIGNGDIIENAAIAIENGYFRFVKDQMRYRIDASEYDTVIYLDKSHIYPGFILPNTTLGIREIDAVRASLDYADVGEYNSHIRSIIAYNTESRITPTVRSNGVLVAQVTPRGGVISGNSSIVHLDAWNWEDAILKKDEGVHLNWPTYTVSHADKEKRSQNQDKINQINFFFEQARAYSKEEKHFEINARFEGLKGVFDGRKTLFVHAQTAKQILQAIVFKRKHSIKKMAIVGGYDAWLIPEALNDNNVGVIYRRVHSLPIREDDPIDLPYRIPFLMKQKGILFCLDMSGDMEAMNSRNLPFVAGTTVAYGLKKEEALQAITLNAAKILGMENLLGTLEAGKLATFFISSGDALEMKENKVKIAFVNGRQIDLDNPQKALYRKYSKKYKQDQQ